MYHMIQDPQNDKLTLSPSFVAEQWSLTLRQRKRQMRQMRKAKHAYESMLMKGESTNVNVTNSPDDGPITSSGTQIIVEVSRMPTIIQTFTGYLFPKSPRTVFSPDVDGRGEPAKGQLACDRWFALSGVSEKLRNAVGQSLLYRGSFLKFGLDLTKTLPQDRVWAKVVPWWDGVLDWEVQDKDEERFRGHSYWEDVAVLERRLGQKIPDDIVRTTRKDYFDASATDKDGNSTGGSKDGRFVHVLEWYNLVDDWITRDEQGNETGRIRGVFELYFVDKIGESRDPFIRTAMPYSHANGDACVPLIPLIFDHEKEHPFKGIAASDRIYAQCYELCMMRSSFANGLRRNARVAFFDKGLVDETAMARVIVGEDGVLIGLEPPEGKSLDGAVKAFQFPPQSQDYSLYENAVERDLSQGVNSPAFSRGEAMGSRTTAYEVKQLNSYMENHLGEMAVTKDTWIASLAKCYLRVLMAAMKAPQVTEETSKPDEIVYIEGPKKVRTTVTVEDIDGDFEIGIVDAASTPMTREARRQDMAVLQPNLLQLWTEAEKGNPMAVTLLKSLVDLYDLPADFSYKALVELKKELAADLEKEAPKEEPTGPDPEKAARGMDILNQMAAQQGGAPPAVEPPPEATQPPVM